LREAVLNVLSEAIRKHVRPPHQQAGPQNRVALDWPRGRVTSTTCPKTPLFGSPQMLDSLRLVFADCKPNKQMILLKKCWFGNRSAILL